MTTPEFSPMRPKKSLQSSVTCVPKQRSFSNKFDMFDNLSEISALLLVYQRLKNYISSARQFFA